MSIETGGPAFPTESEAQTDYATWRHEGMTLRDYFAGEALKDICSNPDSWGPSPRQFAEQAYLIADEMLKERSK